MNRLSDRVGTFTDSVIRRMTRISNEYGAINLSQGFPDFDPPQALRDALARVAYEGPHQYSITFGAKNMRESIARRFLRTAGVTADPETQVLITCGSTEAMMAALMAISNPGDKVVIFSPYFENYYAQSVFNSIEPVFVPLNPPAFTFDANALEDTFRDPKTNAMILL